jgi:tetratricopeptide (TPR) repeat protein
MTAEVIVMRRLGVHRFAVLVLGLATAVPSAVARHGHAPAPGRRPPLYADLGDHRHPVTTKSAAAQRYFDQGLRLVYAFNHDEAVRAFREAARLDPGCAMAWWGIAFASGPNYNMPIDEERDRTAREAMEKATALAPSASPAERDYIEALARRYARPSGADRKELDRAYADAMRAVARRHPDDLDAATLFAESLMVLRPWDLWTRDGTQQPGTEEIVATLEGVIRRDPRHPGANHYYIHAVEASPHPERALGSAARLEGLAPGAGHLVHMPAHVYMRVGRYGDAAESNRRAIAVDEAYIARERPQSVYPMMYYPHNIHFLWAAASMQGRSREALQAARKLAEHTSPEALREMPMLELFAPTPLFALARFGRWEALLAEPAPPEEFPVVAGIWHYTRGLALAATSRLDDAAREQGEVERLAAAVPEDRIIGDNQPARRHLELAAADLAGEIAARRGRTDEAVRRLEEAVRMEDELPYTEPPAWWRPTRQVLGAVLLDAGRSADAEAVYREDLRRNPENGWSLRGLGRSLRERKPEEAAAVDARFRKAWAQADVQLEASRL